MKFGRSGAVRVLTALLLVFSLELLQQKKARSLLKGRTQESLPHPKKVSALKKPAKCSIK